MKAKLICPACGWWVTIGGRQGSSHYYRDKCPHCRLTIHATPHLVAVFNIPECSALWGKCGAAWLAREGPLGEGNPSCIEELEE